MRRASLAILAFAAAMLGGALHAGPAAAEMHVRALEYEVLLPGGGAVDYHFQVAAAGGAEAEAAARAAVEQLAPGSTVRGLHEARDGEVSAAFAFWPWQWSDAELPVAVWYNPAGAPTGATDTDVSAALAPWSAVETSRFAFTFAGTTEAAPRMHQRVADGLNVIGWQDLGCDAGCVLGLTSKVKETHEVDTVLNSDPRALLGDGTGGTVDVTTVLLHEAGHIAGLEHSCGGEGDCNDAARGAVMYYRYQGVQRALQPDDIAGISALYPVDPLPAGGTGGPKPAPRPALNLAVRVDAGWNLVVLPAGPFDDTMQLLPCVRAVYMFGAGGWETWLRDGHPVLNTLTTTDGARAYWVHAEASCSGSTD